MLSLDWSKVVATLLAEAVVTVDEEAPSVVWSDMAISVLRILSSIDVDCPCIAVIFSSGDTAEGVTTPKCLPFHTSDITQCSVLYCHTVLLTMTVVIMTVQCHAEHQQRLCSYVLHV